jgi:hypothetical protein
VGRDRLAGNDGGFGGRCAEQHVRGWGVEAQGFFEHGVEVGVLLELGRGWG